MGANQSAEVQAGAITVIGLGRIVEIAVSETGLTSSQYRALALVKTGIGSSGVLARFLDVRPPTVTTVMNGLVADGLVERIRDASDRRRVDYELTADGAATLEVANAAARQALTGIADHLDADPHSCKNTNSN